MKEAEYLFEMRARIGVRANQDEFFDSGQYSGARAEKFEVDCVGEREFQHSQHWNVKAGDEGAHASFSSKIDLEKT
jgi:hypothetical protein